MDIVTFVFGFFVGMLITDVVITALCYKWGFRWMK